jgi:Ca2+-binding EF-hand superfamily protein
MERKMDRKFLAVALLAGLGLAAWPAQAAMSPIKAFDTDNDGTLDLAEVQNAAGAMFDKLEKDKDGTLDRKEIGAHIGKKEFADADPDDDKTLSKDEYVAHAAALFKEADTDNEGTLDSKELKSKSGKALVRLLR